jgi:lipopolysaccharide export system protein LptA
MSASGRAWIRRGSALLIAAFLIGVAAVGYQRTRRSGDGLGSVDPSEVGFDVADVAIGLYKGFQHTETMKGQPIFILNSLRTLSLASGWQEIEGVRLQFFREGEQGPILTAEKASFNIDTRDARIEGGVHVVFPNGAFLNTEAGQFLSKQQIFVSEAPVMYVDGPTFGQAERASYSLKEDWVKLEGNAALRAEDGAMLVAPKLVYRRDEGLIIFSEGVDLTQHLSRLRAPRATVTLASNDGPPEKIEMSGGVEVTTTVESTGALVEMWGEKVVSKRDASGLWHVRVRSKGPWVKVRFTGGPDYFERTLQTMVLIGVMGAEGIISMKAENGVCLSEIPMEGPPRSASADSGRAWFNKGQLTDVEFDGQVEITADDMVARGQRARLVQASGLAMLQGDPTGRIRVGLDSDRGKMSCDEATLFDREGRIEARGQVHGELQNARLLGAETPQGSDEPVRFAGELIEVEEGGDVYSLRENARIWQGHRLLLADDVVYRHETESVAARGHVRVTFPANQMDETASENEDVVVDARSLDYDSLGGSAVFRGSVHYSDPKYSLAANRLSIAFDENDEVSDVEAEGAVEINDLEMGRRLTGQHARREVKSQVITVTGSPAQLADPRGNVASGESLTWNQADGTVSIGGGTELIYYPEETPEPQSARPRRR